MTAGDVWPAAAWRLTSRQTAVPLRTPSNYQMSEQRHGASTLHLAKLCFNFAYAVCERRFAVCYAFVVLRSVQRKALELVAGTDAKAKRA